MAKGEGHGRVLEERLAAHKDGELVHLNVVSLREARVDDVVLGEDRVDALRIAGLGRQLVRRQRRRQLRRLRPLLLRLPLSAARVPGRAAASSVAVHFREGTEEGTGRGEGCRVRIQPKMLQKSTEKSTRIQRVQSTSTQQATRPSSAKAEKVRRRRGWYERRESWRRGRPERLQRKGACEDGDTISTSSFHAFSPRRPRPRLCAPLARPRRKWALLEGRRAGAWVVRVVESTHPKSGAVCAEIR